MESGETRLSREKERGPGEVPFIENINFIPFIERFFNGRFIIGNDYVRMYVTLVNSSWVVVAGVLTGVDFIPLKFLRITE